MLVLGKLSGYKTNEVKTKFIQNNICRATNNHFFLAVSTLPPLPWFLHGYVPSLSCSAHQSLEQTYWCQIFISHYCTVATTNHGGGQEMVGKGQNWAEGWECEKIQNIL